MSNLVIDIEGIDFEKSNIIFVNGMTMEKVKLYYPWLLNAKVKDVIIGEDDYGIIWYFGDWYCGEWIDGSWFSGNFYQGNWNNGRWFSYKLNKFDVINEKTIIENTDNDNSIFHNGVWLNGTFENGTFGKKEITEDWKGYELYTYVNDDYLEIEISNFKKGNIEKDLATWVNGIWKNGIFVNTIWENGIFNGGEIINSMWLNGEFYFGVFDGNTWYNGKWYNGDFIRGDWLDGIFTWLNPDKISRFGAVINPRKYEDIRVEYWTQKILADPIWYAEVKEKAIIDLNSITYQIYLEAVWMYLHTDEVQEYQNMCSWKNGEWKNGEWFSGYQLIDDVASSINNRLAIWEDGIWRNGTWFGGHFKRGEWYNGLWKDGIFGNVEVIESLNPKYVYETKKPLNPDEVIINYDNLTSSWSATNPIISNNSLKYGLSSTTYNLDYVQSVFNYQTDIGGLIIISGSTTNECYIRNHTYDNNPIILGEENKLYVNMITGMDIVSGNEFEKSGTTLENGILDKSRLFKTGEYIKFTNIIPTNYSGIPSFNFWFKNNNDIGFDYQTLFDADDFKIMIKIDNNNNFYLKMNISSEVGEFHYSLSNEYQCWHHIHIKEKIGTDAFDIWLDNQSGIIDITPSGLSFSNATLSSSLDGLNNINIEDFRIDFPGSTMSGSTWENRNYINEKRDFTDVLEKGIIINIDNHFYEINNFEYVEDYYKYVPTQNIYLGHSWTKIELIENINLLDNILIAYNPIHDISITYKSKINIGMSGFVDGYVCSNTYISDLGNQFTLRYQSNTALTYNYDYLYIKDFDFTTKVLYEYNFNNYGVDYTVIVTRTKITDLNDLGFDDIEHGKKMDFINHYHNNQMKRNFVSESLIFHGFDDLDISNMDKIISLNVNFEKKIIKNSYETSIYPDFINEEFANFSGIFKDNSIGLPFKDLTYENQFDYLLYDYPYYDNRYDDNEIQYSSKAYPEEFNDNDFQKFTYGTVTDLWRLTLLPDFYDASGYNKDDYDITLPSAIKNKLRIETSFKIDQDNVDDAIMNKVLSITHPTLKISYTSFTSAVWFNGNFEKGVWINGTFEDGNIYSAIVLDGIFNNGYLGYEQNPDRQINSGENKRNDISTNSL